MLLLTTPHTPTGRALVRVDEFAISLVISTLASILLLLSSIMRDTLWQHVDGGVVLMLGARNSPNGGTL